MAGEMFSVEMLPAYIGDSLWIEYGSSARLHRVLIDGGLVGTTEILRRRIEAVAEAEGSCHLDLVVISHVDADHIEGMVKLLGDPGLPLTFDDLWFNGSAQLPDPEGEDEEEFLGAKQGEYLSALLEARELPWNRFADGGTIYVPPESRGGLPRTTLAGGMELVLLSPTYDKLVSLARRWEKEIRKAGLDGASSEEVLAALLRDRRLAPDDEFLGAPERPDVPVLLEADEKTDSSPANGGSIAFLAGYAGSRCLLAADAHSPVLRSGIDRLLADTGDDRLALSAFKLSHHGSDANLEAELLDRLDCHRFLVSTNGRRFHHPDPEAIARVVGGSWRGPDIAGDEAVELCFNYRSEYSGVWDDVELQAEWNYRTVFPDAEQAGLLVHLDPVA